MMKKCLFPFAAFVLCGIAAQEYFVDPSGEYENHPAFRSIGEGIAAMSTGDTLTVAPGEYRENLVIGPFAGDSGQKTTIRAAIPQSVLVSGSDKQFLFRNQPGSAYAYVARGRGNVTGVCEIDTFTHLEKVDDPDLPGKRRGVFCYVPEIDRLIVSSSDGNPAKRHKYHASHNAIPGIRIAGTKENPVKNLLLTGFVVSGFHAPDASAGGIRIEFAENIEIGGCLVFDNDEGMDFSDCRNCSVFLCDVYGNRTHNLRFCGGENNAVTNCRSFYSKTGIVAGENVRFKNTVSFFNGKDAEGDVSGIFAADLLRSLFSDEFLRENCADPDQMDFRFQRGKSLPGVQCGENDADICFVSPDGDDGNSGSSPEEAWKTFRNLRPHSTVYMMPGNYPGDLVVNASFVTIRSRGNGKAANISGGVNGIQIKAPHVCLDRIQFADQERCAVSVEASHCRVERCGFTRQKTGISAYRIARIAICHNSFDYAIENTLRLNECKGISHSNLFASRVNVNPGVYSNFNGFFVNNIPAAEEYTLRRVPMFENTKEGDFSLKRTTQYVGRGLTGFPMGIYELDGTPARNIFAVRKIKDGDAEWLSWESSRSDDFSAFRYCPDKDSSGWENVLVQNDGVRRKVRLNHLSPGIYRFEIKTDVPGNHHRIPRCGKILENPDESGRFIIE